MIIRARAPLRLSFGGGGTELQPYVNKFSGLVFSSTIDLYCYSTLKPSEEKKIVFHSIDQNLSTEYSSKLNNDHAFRLHSGVYNYVKKYFNNDNDLYIDLSTYSEAPAGSGLGSSSTLTIAILKAFDDFLNLGLGEYDLARIAHKIERTDLKLKGGLQDHYAAAFGGFNFIEFHKNDHVIVNPINVRGWIKSELESRLLLCFTGKSRFSGNLIEETTSLLLKNDKSLFENLNKTKNVAIEMKNSLLQAEFDKFGKILDKSWQIKKQFNKNISNKNIDDLYQTAIDNGAIGGKVSGAGGGGFLMLVTEFDKKSKVVDALIKLGGEVKNVKFSDQGAYSWRLVN